LVYNLIIAEQTVGNVNLKATSYHQIGNIISRVTVRATYNLNENFFSYVNTLICNGVSVNLNNGVGIITVSTGDSPIDYNLINGPLVLNTIFNFKE